MEYIALFRTLFDKFSSILEPYLNWYIIIFIYSFIYFLYFIYVNKIMGKEMQKRKEIIQDIHLYKITHPNELYPKVNDDKMKSILHYNQPEYPESYYLALENIVKRWKAQPLRALFLVIIQYWLFLSLLTYCLSLKGNIHDYSVFYYVDIVLMGFLLYGKRLVWLRVISLIATIIAYRFFTPEALLFTGLVFFYRLLNANYLKLTKTNKKQKSTYSKKENN